MTEDFKELAAALWSQLLGEWIQVDDDTNTWRKEGMFTAFIAESDIGGFDFVLHVNDGAFPAILLPTSHIEEAKKLGDDLIRQFVSIGNSLLERDEIRLIQTHSHGGVLFGIAADGKMYRFNGPDGWSSQPMKISH